MANIQIVLREDVTKLGKAGELVRVKPGYARNFLIPRGFAVVATKGSIAKIEHEKAAAISLAAKTKKSAEAIATKLSAVSVTISKPAGEEGRLFGSVTSKEIVDALEAKGFSIEKKQIHHEALKQVGTFNVTAKLGPEVTATFKVEIVAKS